MPSICRNSWQEMLPYELSTAASRMAIQGRFSHSNLCLCSDLGESAGFGDLHEEMKTQIPSTWNLVNIGYWQISVMTPLKLQTTQTNQIFGLGTHCYRSHLKVRKPDSLATESDPLPTLKIVWRRLISIVSLNFGRADLSQSKRSSRK